MNLKQSNMSTKSDPATSPTENHTSDMHVTGGMLR